MATLIPRFTLGALELTDYPFSVQFGTDMGHPESVYELLGSLLPDGGIESLSRRENRTITLPILIEGADLAEVAAAEAALIAECDKQRNTLTIDPGDGFGPPTVFDTFAASPSWTRDDNEEMATLRRWTLTIKALPYGRSVDKIIDDAGTPPVSAGTLLYACDSATGWSKWSTYAGFGGPVGTDITADSTVKIEGAASVRAHAQYSYNYYESTKWTFYTSSDKVTGLSLDTDTGGYLAISIKVVFTDQVLGGPGLRQLWMTTAAGEQEITNFVAVERRADGFVRYAWPVSSGLIVTGLRFEVMQTSVAAYPETPYVWYDRVELLPSATTDHQIVKQLEVRGSARTSGSLRISAPSEAIALGSVLAITAPTAELPAGFQPDGRRWVTQGSTTPDVTALGGSYLMPDSDAYSASAPSKPIFDIPVNMLTAGPYTMVALVKAESTSLKFGVQAQLQIGASSVGPTSSAEVSPSGLLTGWQFIPVGTVYLPPLPIQGANTENSKVRLLFKGAKFADIYFIPAWEVGGRQVADYSIVDCGTGAVEPGGASSSLWIDTPSTSQPQGGWWRGPTADRLNAQSAWPDAKKPGVHAFKPGSLTAFLVSTGAQGPTMALEYYPAWVGSAAL